MASVFGKREIAYENPLKKLNITQARTTVIIKDKI